MRGLTQDLRYALRSLRKSPGFTAVAVLTLALGIGGNTAVFSVVNGVLLKPLPYPDADRVAYLGWLWSRDADPAVLSAPKFAYWREHSRVFEGVASYKTFGRRLGADGEGYVQGLRVSDDFFEVIGIPPALGRGFTAEESKPGGPRVAVLGHRLWRDLYGGNPDVVGRTIRLDDEPFTVVGVAGADFRLVGHEEYGDVLVPLQLEIDPRDSGHNYPVIARLGPDVTPEMAEADMARVFRAFRAEYPDRVRPEEAGMRLFSHADLFADDVRNHLWILLAASLLVLLIACADVANLLLARATGRRREMATRAALGAGRGRIIRQILAESLLLGLAASGLGLLLAFWSLDALLAAVPVSMPRTEEIGLDGRVLVFTLAIGMATALIFGLAGALALSRIEPAAEPSGSRVGAGRGARRTSNALVVVESALSLVLLVGAGLLIASLFELRAVDPGFDPEGVLTVSFPRPPAEYESTAEISMFERQALDRMRALPGIEDAAAVSSLPLERGWNIPMTVVGRPDATEGAVEWRAISPGYLATMEIPLVRGRRFTVADDAGAAPVVLVNEALAERYWPDGDAPGKRLVIGQIEGRMISPDMPSTPREVVGIVADARDIGLDLPARRTVFVPQAQMTDRLAIFPRFVIRTSSPAPVANAVTGAIRVVDPRLTEIDFRPMEEIVSTSLERERFAMLLMGAFAGLALLLTALGIYGVVSYTVGRRTREIGIRAALGARRRQVLGLVLWQGMLPVTIGLVIGLIVAFAGARILAGMIYGVNVRDPATFIAVAVLLTAVALLATWLPARRAARVDPVTALRAE